MHASQQHGLVFNGEKCEVKKDSVTFFCTVYDADGAHPDPKKVDADAITRDPITTATVLGNGHLPLSIHSITLYTHYRLLWELLKKESEFNWNTYYQEAWDQEISFQGYNSSLL